MGLGIISLIAKCNFRFYYLKLRPFEFLVANNSYVFLKHYMDVDHYCSLFSICGTYTPPSYVTRNCISFLRIGMYNVRRTYCTQYLKIYIPMSHKLLQALNFPQKFTVNKHYISLLWTICISLGCYYTRCAIVCIFVVCFVLKLQSQLKQSINFWKKKLLHCQIFRGIMST